MPIVHGGSFSLNEAAVVAVLALAPLGHLLTLPTGIRASGTDLLIGGFALSFGLTRSGRRPAAGIAPTLVLMAFGVWCLLGSTWSPTPGYATTKGVAYGVLLACAYAVAQSDAVRSGIAYDGWIVGVCLALLTVAAGLMLGGSARERVLFGGGGISGLGFPRVRGPFAHPNEFGGFLAVSIPLVWARGEKLRNRFGGPVVVALWGAVTTTLIFTASSAWLGVGVLLVAAGICASDWSPIRRVFAGLAGAATACVVFLAAVGKAPSGVLIFNGIRPSIWRSTMEAVGSAPIRGVGATPVIASAVDPAAPQWGPLGWDAHQLVLSLWAQFGGVGLLLFFAAWSLAAWRVYADILRSRTEVGFAKNRRKGDRLRWAVLAAALVWFTHGLLIANEDLRHGWLLFGLLMGLETQQRRKPQSP